MTMPAMSPTMTEGAVGSWKVKEGPFVSIPSSHHANSAH